MLGKYRTGHILGRIKSLPQYEKSQIMPVSPRHECVERYCMERAFGQMVSWEDRETDEENSKLKADTLTGRKCWAVRANLKRQAEKKNVSIRTDDV